MCIITAVIASVPIKASFISQNDGKNGAAKGDTVPKTAERIPELPPKE
jgi:hypothetical protein